MKFSPNAPCPCHSGRKYKKCCRSYHEGSLAPTPEALMRSRYSAYALNRAEYIIQTTDPEGPMWRTDEATWRADLEAFSTQTRFAGLIILAADTETVTFRAILSHGKQDISFTERSVFRREDGRWLYTSAQEMKDAASDQSNR